MEEIKKGLEQEELEQASGGSIFYIESVIRGAGIDLLREDGTPGEFGYLWNTGDYCFQGQKLDSKDIKALVQYKKIMAHQPLRQRQPGTVIRASATKEDGDTPKGIRKMNTKWERDRTALLAE